MRVMAEAAGACGVDVGKLPHRQGAGAHHPGAARNERHGDRGDDVVRAGAEDRHDRQRHDDQRERHEDVHEALENEVETAAEVGAGHAQHQPCGGPQKGRRQSNDHGRPGAMEQPRQARRGPNWSVPNQCAQPGGRCMRVEGVAQGGRTVR